MRLVLTQPRPSFQGDSFSGVDELLRPLLGTLSPQDIVLLPEHVDRRGEASAYRQQVCALARRHGCHVVGGSHHERQASSPPVNRGVVSGPQGQVIGSYEKLRPYASERQSVAAGEQLGEFVVGGLRVLVLICADFWFSDLLYGTSASPDLILVPAYSVSRKPDPSYSRGLWRHLAVSRAYEFGVYVGVSDWAYLSDSAGPVPSAVAGFADPTRVEVDALFQPVRGQYACFEIDLVALEAFRADRRARGFFWR